MKSKSVSGINFGKNPKHRKGNYFLMTITVSANAAPVIPPNTILVSNNTINTIFSNAVWATTQGIVPITHSITQHINFKIFHYKKAADEFWIDIDPSGTLVIGGTVSYSAAASVFMDTFKAQFDQRYAKINKDNDIPSF